MYSTIVRAQNVFGFFTSVAFAVAALIAASDLLSVRETSGEVRVGKVEVVKGRPHYYSTKKEEYAKMTFNLDADLSSLFTWNTKQVFVYITASWPAESKGNSQDVESGEVVLNEAVIWDTIITSPSADHLMNIGPIAMKKLKKSAAGKSIDPNRGILSLKSQRAKYQITSPSGKLANTSDVTLHLHYNVQPWVGILSWRPQIEFGKWRLMRGGVSAAFGFPAVKGVKTAKVKG